MTVTVTRSICDCSRRSSCDSYCCWFETDTVTATVTETVTGTFTVTVTVTVTVSWSSVRDQKPHSATVSRRVSFYSCCCRFETDTVSVTETVTGTFTVKVTVTVLVPRSNVRHCAFPVPLLYLQLIQCSDGLCVLNLHRYSVRKQWVKRATEWVAERMTERAEGTDDEQCICAGDCIGCWYSICNRNSYRNFYCYGYGDCYGELELCQGSGTEPAIVPDTEIVASNYKFAILI